MIILSKNYRYCISSECDKKYTEWIYKKCSINVRFFNKTTNLKWTRSTNHFIVTRLLIELWDNISSIYTSKLKRKITVSNYKVDYFICNVWYCNDEKHLWRPSQFVCVTRILSLYSKETWLKNLMTLKSQATCFTEFFSG